jgi:hypothetical protein
MKLFCKHNWEVKRYFRQEPGEAKHFIDIKKCTKCRKRKLISMLERAKMKREL